MSLSKRNSKSLPPIVPKPSYIEKSIGLLQQGCYQNKKLKIDDSIGDYRMNLFRLKQRKQYLKDIKTIFTSSFTDSLLPKDINSKDVREQIQALLKQPIIHTIDSSRSDLYYSKLPREKSIKDQQNIEQSKQKKMQKGSYISTLQEDDHLFCNYLPDYQQKRWFQLKNRNSITPTLIQNTQISNMSKVKRKSLIKASNKSKHIFAYLSNPLFLQRKKK